MIKPTKRKFIGNIKADFSFDEIENLGKYAKKPSEVDFNEYNKIFFQANDNTIVQGFVCLINKKPLYILEPEPSILYFINAENKLPIILEAQSDIFNTKMTEKNFNHLTDSFYNFFQQSSDFIINLFTSIEAFNNSLIPDNFSIKIKKRNYNKQQIQKSIDFQRKTEMIIPKIMNKSFPKDYSSDYEFIVELKKLRNNVIHTKNLTSGFPACYRELYVSYLNFDFEQSYNVVKKYMNYYNINWIESY